MRMILLEFIDSAAEAQAAETPIVAVRADYGVFWRDVQLRENLAYNFFLAEDAAVSENPEFIALWVIRNPASGEFLIFAVGNLPAFHKVCPVVNVAALENSKFSVVSRLGQRC